MTGPWLERLLADESPRPEDVLSVARQVDAMPRALRAVVAVVGSVAAFAPRPLRDLLRRAPMTGMVLAFVSALHAAAEVRDEGTHAVTVGDPVTPRVRSKPGRRYDAVVIGSGPGGAIAAFHAARGGREVLVVDEGPAIPTGSLPHPSRAQTAAQVRWGGNGAIVGLPPVLYAEGRTLGGGSEVNSGFYHRLPEAIRDRWLDVTGFSRSEWEAAERQVEDRLSVSAAPIDLAPHPLELGATALGLTAEPVPLWSRFDGPAPAHQGMLRTYLADAVGAGAEVVASTRATRVVRSGGRLAVEVRDAGGERIEIATTEVVVAAGAFGTPALLAESGLARLRDVRVRLQPMLRVAAEFDRDVNPGGLPVPIMVRSADGRFKVSTAVATPPFLAMTLRGMGVGPDTVPSPARAAAFYASFTARRGARLVGTASRHVAVIDWDSRDRRDMREGLDFLREILRAGGALRMWPARGLSPVTTVHLASSMPLASGVVDRLGRLVAEPRIRVSDASMLPSLPWVNPQGPLCVLAELVSGAID